jgi:hypothetical protein
MDRTEGELTRHIFARASRPPRGATTSTPRGTAEDYLNLIAYRTADLETAAGHLTPFVKQYFDRRAAARADDRARNLTKVFKPASWAAPAPLAANPPPVGPTIAIVVSNDLMLVGDLDQAADGLFQANQSLTHYVVIGDHISTAVQGPVPEHPRFHVVCVKKPNTGPTLHRAEEELPADLPFRPNAELERAGIVPPVRGVNLLAWSADESTERALRAIAEESL